MLRIRESRAFTMIELIVVIVILGILAAIAAVSYQAVIDNSRKKGVEQTASQLDKEARALAAFDQSAPSDKISGGAAANATATGPAMADLGSGVTVKVGTKTYTDANNVSHAASFVVTAANGAQTCLTVGQSYGTPGSTAGTVASGSLANGVC